MAVMLHTPPSLKGLPMRRLLLALAFGVLSVAACYQDDTSALAGLPGRPLTRILLTDAPFPYDQVLSVDVHIVRVQASTSADTGGASVWTTVAEPRRTFDLLQLQQGATALLGETELPAGQYRSIRVTFNPDLSRIRLRNNADAEVNWQRTGEQDLYALVEEPLVVPAGGAQIVIDFDVGRSFYYEGTTIEGNPRFTFFYVLRAVNSAVTGSLTGTVLADTGTGTPVPMVDANVTVFSGNPDFGVETWWVAATGHTDGTGHYRIGYLREGTYHVRVEPRTSLAASLTTENITITRGAETTHSVTLPARRGAFVDIVGNAVLPFESYDTLEAVVVNSSGQPVSNPVVSWEVFGSAVQLLNNSGRFVTVRGAQLGISTVVASSEGVSDSLVIEVRAGGDTSSTAPVATVEVSPSGDTLTVNDSTGFTATLRDAGGNVLSNRPITWTSSNSTVLQILGAFGPSVVVRAVGAGTANLTAASEGQSSFARVVVSP
ncbi:MAG: DUF4382 domain-containing protein [Gemmatimonadales bacterium]